MCLCFLESLVRARSCFLSQDLKATAAGVSSKSSKSPSASSSSSSGVAPAAPAAASRSINVNFDLFETLLDGYCAIDEDGLVLYVNAALERMFGYSRRKVIGHVSKEKKKKEESKLRVSDHVVFASRMSKC